MSNPEDNLDELHEACELLRTIEPSLAARVRNYKVVAAELSCLQSSGVPVSWWRKSISLPISVIIALAVVMCFVMSLPWMSRYEKVIPQESPRLADESVTNLAKHGGTRVVTSTYLCGVGRVGYHAVQRYEE